ncbi:MAG: hypothetical protein R3242_09350 [Akkermansiaceae bacterium]|nr:hypothetical protein [Akkermansiaceae bacterium]
MKRYLPMLGLVVLAIAFLVWRSLPEQVIKRRCKALIELLDQMDAGASVFDYNRLDGLLADRIEFRIDLLEEELVSADREQALSAYRWMSDEVKRSSFSIAEFRDIEFEGDEARVRMEVESVVEMPDIRSLDGRHACEFLWQRDGKGDWRLEGLSWSESPGS